MTTIVFLIEQWAIGLYAMFAAALLYLLWRYSRAQHALRGTHFELERDLARYERSNIVTAILVVIELALVIAGIQFVVAPTLRTTTVETIEVADAVSDGVFNTPTPQPLVGEFEIDSSGVQLGDLNPADSILPTPTQTPTPVGTLVPNSPAPLGCDTPQATLQVPGNGMIVFQTTVIRGTATTENFAFYRFELNGPSTGGSFAPLYEGTVSVTELGDLGQFVPSFYQTGEYRFRLAVFDTTSTLRAACEVTIYISEPIPTPTPLTTGSAGAP
jgi:hypothetical protein